MLKYISNFLLDKKECSHILTKGYSSSSLNKNNNEENNKKEIYKYKDIINKSKARLENTSILNILYWASMDGNLSLIKFLIFEYHLTINDITSKNNRCLRYACEYGHLNIVKYLTSTNLNEDIKSKMSIEEIASYEEVSPKDMIRSKDYYAYIYSIINQHFNVTKYIGKLMGLKKWTNNHIYENAVINMLASETLNDGASSDWANKFSVKLYIKDYLKKLN